jgi:hypothetical protein
VAAGLSARADHSDLRFAVVWGESCNALDFHLERPLRFLSLLVVRCLAIGSVASSTEAEKQPKTSRKS